MTMKMHLSEFGINVGNVTRGQVKTTCPECSKTRKKTNDKCLSVDVTEGVWHCHHCNWKGSLKERKKDYQVFEISEKTELKIYEYFKKRGITEEVVNRNRITTDEVFFPLSQKKETAICFNYFFNNELVNIKYRGNNKAFTQKKGGYSVFYKIDDIANKDFCIITEGEIDALSFDQIGYKNAISVPSGANLSSNGNCIDNNYIELIHLEKIYLAVDKDEKGLQLQTELARRLGAERCLIVNFPEGCKDANEVLVKHGELVLEKCLKDAELYPVDGIITESQLHESVKKIYKRGFENGAITSFKNLNSMFQFFPGQLTVVTGIPSHGKSTFIDNLVIDLARNSHWKTAIFSPENALTEVHIIRLMKIFIRKSFFGIHNTTFGRMQDVEVDKAGEFINKNIFFIKPSDDSYTIDNVLELALQLVKKKGIRMLVIDPYNSLEHTAEKGDSETAYIAKFLNKLRFFARKHQVHLIVIAHPKKVMKNKDNVFEVPDPYDVSGSANWYNVSDNFFTVYKNTSVTELHVKKVKHSHYGKLGTCYFNFNTDTEIFTEFQQIKKEWE